MVPLSISNPFGNDSSPVNSIQRRNNDSKIFSRSPNSSSSSISSSSANSTHSSASLDNNNNKSSNIFIDINNLAKKKSKNNYEQLFYNANNASKMVENDL